MTEGDCARCEWVGIMQHFLATLVAAADKHMFIYGQIVCLNLCKNIRKVGMRRKKTKWRGTEWAKSITKQQSWQEESRRWINNNNKTDCYTCVE